MSGFFKTIKNILNMAWRNIKKCFVSSDTPAVHNRFMMMSEATQKLVDRENEGARKWKAQCKSLGYLVRDEKIMQLDMVSEMNSAFSSVELVLREEKPLPVSNNVCRLKFADYKRTEVIKPSYAIECKMPQLEDLTDEKEIEKPWCYAYIHLDNHPKYLAGVWKESKISVPLYLYKIVGPLIEEIEDVRTGLRKEEYQEDFINYKIEIIKRIVDGSTRTKILSSAQADKEMEKERLEAEGKAPPHYFEEWDLTKNLDGWDLTQSEPTAPSMGC